jgi:transcription elongation GreA/GreB family factor
VAAETDEEARKVLLRDLRYWHTRQTTAELAPEPEEGEVGIGSSVRVRMNGAERTIVIVGGDEAEPGEDRLAFSAPLARALMGAAVGETVAFAGKADAIEIVEIA